MKLTFLYCAFLGTHRQYQSNTPVPTMDGVTWDVIVVGAGVVGSAAAYQLAKQGFKTLLIEQVARMHRKMST